MSRERDPGRPIEAVQNAAIEHALTAGESRAALALVGALEPLRDPRLGRDGESGRPGGDNASDPASAPSASSPSATVSPDAGPSSTAPSMALSSALTAWIGLRLRSDRDVPTRPTAPTAPTTTGPSGGDAPRTQPSPSSTEAGGAADWSGDEPDGSDRSSDHRGGGARARPAVIGAAVACERFDVSPSYAASLAECSVFSVRQVAAERGDAEGSANDPPSGE
ncbi:hypothetical protein [Halobaculum halobium]|uniref:Uncharacterized protein n=1 Tax=Halobaculum halobium TaxID=3032281 RepID=A0ABD5TAM7_9EURY|nr:hypothetical protein [Halobaculum sp. SYNS20]